MLLWEVQQVWYLISSYLDLAHFDLELDNIKNNKYINCISNYVEN